MKDKLMPENGCLVQLNVDSINRDNRCDLQGAYESGAKAFAIFNKYHTADRSQYQIFHMNRHGGVNLIRISAEHCIVATPSIYSDEFFNMISNNNIINEELCKFGKPEDIYPAYTRLKHELIQEMTEEEIITKIGFEKLKEHIVRCLMALDSAEERLHQIKQHENVRRNSEQSSGTLEKVVVEPINIPKRRSKPDPVDGRGLKEILTQTGYELHAATDITDRPISFNDFFAKEKTAKPD